MRREQESLAALHGHGPTTILFPRLPPVRACPQ